MTQNIHIAGVLEKQFAISQEDAEKLFPYLKTAVESKRELVLSFRDIEVCSTIFLRNLLGELYLQFGEEVDKFIHLSDIASDDETLPTQLERLRRRALSPDIYRPIFESAIGLA